MAGVPPRPIMALLGHRDPRMTLRYQHLSPDHLRDAARALDQRPALVEVAPAHTARPVASAGSARARGAGRQPQATAMMTGASTDHDTDAPSSRWPRWSKARLLAVTSSSPEQLREAIAREQAGLAGLDDERRQAQARLAALQDALAALEAPSVFPLVPLLPGSTRPEVPIFLRMFEKRVRGYRAIGYARDAAPLAADASADGQLTGFQILDTPSRGNRSARSEVALFPHRRKAPQTQPPSKPASLS